MGAHTSLIRLYWNTDSLRTFLRVICTLHIILIDVIQIPSTFPSNHFAFNLDSFLSNARARVTLMKYELIHTFHMIAQHIFLLTLEWPLIDLIVTQFCWWCATSAVNQRLFTFIYSFLQPYELCKEQQPLFISSLFNYYIHVVDSNDIRANHGSFSWCHGKLYRMGHGIEASQQFVSKNIEIQKRKGAAVHWYSYMRSRMASTFSFSRADKMSLWWFDEKKNGKKRIAKQGQIKEILTFHNYALLSWNNIK